MFDFITLLIAVTELHLYIKESSEQSVSGGNYCIALFMASVILFPQIKEKVNLQTPCQLKQRLKSDYFLWYHDSCCIVSRMGFNINIPLHDTLQ